MFLYEIRKDYLVCFVSNLYFHIDIYPVFFFFYTLVPYPVGLYPLNNFYKTDDASCYGNLGGTAQDVKLVTGPSGKENTAYKFAGIGTSYINIPTFQHINTRTSITILVWIFQTGQAGSVFEYLNSSRVESHSPRTYSVELHTSRTNSFSAQFVKPNGKLVSLTNNAVNLVNQWHYVGVSYDHNSGTATLWVNGKDVQQMSLEKMELSTDRDIQIGSGQGKGDSFQGRISCLQIYDRALTREEVIAVKNRCFKDGPCMYNFKTFVICKKSISNLVAL